MQKNFLFVLFALWAGLLGQARAEFPPILPSLDAAPEQEVAAGKQRYCYLCEISFSYRCERGRSDSHASTFMACSVNSTFPTNDDIDRLRRKWKNITRTQGETVCRFRKEAMEEFRVTDIICKKIEPEDDDE